MMPAFAEESDPTMPDGAKRWLILAACLLMLICLGTAQAWSVYVESLQRRYGLSFAQTQLVFATNILVFCTWMIVAGRLWYAGIALVAVLAVLAAIYGYLRTTRDWGVGIGGSV